MWSKLVLWANERKFPCALRVRSSQPSSTESRKYSWKREKIETERTVSDPCVYKARKKDVKIFSLISKIRFNWSAERASFEKIKLSPFRELELIGVVKFAGSQTSSRVKKNKSFGKHLSTFNWPWVSGAGDIHRRSGGLRFYMEQAGTSTIHFLLR